MDTVNICIVTPNLNMGLYLEETILSVLSNMDINDEYYIVDGGSIDNSLEIIKKYQSKITGWISEPDFSYADAISKGFKMTNLSHLCWVGSGDLLLSGSIKFAKKIFNSNNVDFIYGDDICINENGNLIQISNGNVYDIANFMYYGKWSPLQDACFWTRDIYERVGGLNINLKYAADYDLFLKITNNCNSIYIPYTFSAFRKHDGQTSIKYKKLYRLEQNMAKKSLKSFKYNVFKHAFFYILARVRARLFVKKNTSSNIIGKKYDMIKSNFTRNYL